MPRFTKRIPRDTITLSFAPQIHSTTTIEPPDKSKRATHSNGLIVCCVFFPYFSLCIGQPGVAAPFTGWNYIAFNIYRGRRTLMQIAAAVSGVIQGSLKILTSQLSLQTVNSFLIAGVSIYCDATYCALES